MTNHASLETPPTGADPQAAADPAASGAVPAAEANADGLVVRAVSKRWAERVILEAAELTIVPGTSAWVGGRNGVGKTTLLRVIAGLVAPDAGTVALRGLDPVRDRRRYQRNLGFLSAGDRGLYARLTVRQNMQLWARLALLSSAACETAVRDAGATFGLTDLLDSRADRLSLGQRQRVRLALAFLHSPRLVLLDEPANSMDDDGLELIADAIEQLHRRGGMAIWCSPNRPQLAQLGSGWVLRDGRLWEDR
jgi:ABC-2 type transport system ATP-binding protein